MKDSPLGIREIAERARAVGGHDLAQGVIDATPPHVLIDQLSSLAWPDASIYNNQRGVQAYRESLKFYLKTRNWDLPLESIIGTAGAIGAQTAALLSHCAPGDTVLLPEPFFIGHKLLLETLGYNVQYVPFPIGESPQWDLLETHMPNASALLLTTPANPTGDTIDSDSLQKLSTAAGKNSCLLILDEVYREFIWNESSPDDTAYQDIDLSHTVITRSFSKSLAIPGWRTGFAITSPERAEQIAAKHDPLYIGASTLAQHTVAQSLSNHLPELNTYVQETRQLLLQNQETLSEAFSGFGMDPLSTTATYYMLIKHNRSSERVAIEELMAKKVFATPAQILYQNPATETSYIRIHFGVAANTAKAVHKALS